MMLTTGSGEKKGLRSRIKRGCKCNHKFVRLAGAVVRASLRNQRGKEIRKNRKKGNRLIQSGKEGIIQLRGKSSGSRVERGTPGELWGGSTGIGKLLPEKLRLRYRISLDEGNLRQSKKRSGSGLKGKKRGRVIQRSGSRRDHGQKLVAKERKSGKNIKSKHCNRKSD